MAPRFIDLSPDAFTHATVILDVDGTLVPDGEEVMSDEYKTHLTRLAEEARVYVASNTRGPERLHTLVDGTNATIIRAPHRKPDIRILEGISRAQDFIVIGDKYLTDGLLAARIRARFIKITSLRNGNERMFVRMSYLLDAMLGRTVCSLIRAFS